MPNESTDSHDFTWYQGCAARTAVYQEACDTMLSRVLYLVAGLTSETGEVADKVKKFIRDKNGAILLDKGTDYLDITDPRFRDTTEGEVRDIRKLQEDIKKELGDVLWYVAMLSDEFGLDLHDVMLGNVHKLTDRASRDKLHGSGDDR